MRKKILLATLAVAFAAVFLRFNRHLALKVPNVGFILFAILGGDLPAYIVPAVYHEEFERVWVTPNKTVLISSSAKSGTTWNLQIVHQLRTKGESTDFRDIRLEVPWIEYLYAPSMSTIDKVANDAKWASKYDLRAFCSHFGPPVLKVRDDVKYLVVVRNPLDAIKSMRSFFSNISPEFKRLWGGFPPTAEQSDDEYARWVLEDMGDGSKGALKHFFIEFYNGWYPYKDEANVMLAHYSDIKIDVAGHLRKVADFLDLTLTQEEFKKVEKHVSFEWMKIHSSQFDVNGVMEDEFIMKHTGNKALPVMKSGRIINEGKDGGGSELSTALKNGIERQARELISDDEQLRFWFHGSRAS